MDTAFFRSFCVDNSSLSQPVEVTPSTFDDSTPVVVVELTFLAAGEVLGVSKIKGGNRYATTYLSSMSIVFYPAEQKCRLWLTV
ncbi:hypothetical protein LTR36_005354 [Oleoguttula mirabilis]|uniref:Uncharacterized protein n=1 Tax=Oleoguttula mirabilis TaxID=1507867 RepID=A0AAV9JEQ4_9PEZI|nr:hypothetical protein LTR36_005354 [Oleoguttula mirabilis]